MHGAGGPTVATTIGLGGGLCTLPCLVQGDKLLHGPSTAWLDCLYMLVLVTLICRHSKCEPLATSLNC